MILPPEKLTTEDLEALDALPGSLCPVCKGTGLMYKYIVDNITKYYMRCDPGHVLTVVSRTPKDCVKTWERAVQQLITFMKQNEKSYGQKKVHNGRT